MDGCEVRLGDPCALVRPRVPCVVPFVSRLPRGVFLPVDSGNEDDAREGVRVGVLGRRCRRPRARATALTRVA